MQKTFVPIALLAALLAGCGSDGDATSTGSSSAPAAAVAGAASPVTLAAVAFADSLAGLPKADKADVAAARAYAASVRTWEASELSPAVKGHPVVASVWKRYRHVLQAVVRSRGMKRVKPEDAATWNGFTPKCEEAIKILLGLMEEPAVTPTQALNTLVMAESAMGKVRFAAERHMTFLEHPYMRDR